MGIPYELRGGETLANTIVTGNQDSARIAFLSDGRFVIVWRDSSASGGDTSGTSVRGQIFNANGSKAGADFLVNTATLGSQLAPSVLALTGGAFVVSWTDSNSAGDGNGTSVKAQRFGADGAKAGTEFLVNTNTSGGQDGPSMAALADGGFVISWSDSRGDSGGTSRAVKAQRFDAAGDKLGTEILVNVHVGGTQTNPWAASLPGGGFVIAWQDNSGIADPDFSIRVRSFNGDGSAASPELVVNTEGAGVQERPAVAALAGGGFVVVWTDHSGAGGDPGSAGIKAQLFDSDGLWLGSEFLVNEVTAGSQTGVFLTALADGGFAVAWTDASASGGDTSGTAVKVRIFDSAGAAVDGEVLVNSETAGGQFANAIAAGPDGLVATWSDTSGAGGDPSGSSIKFTRLVAAPGTDSDDTLAGTEFRDTLHGFGGDDSLSGLGGRDELSGGDGADELSGGGGEDRLDGGEGDDALAGGGDADILAGGDGADSLDGGSGADQLAGGAGGDSLLGGDGADQLDGGAGDDTLDGGEGDDRLTHVSGPAAPGLDSASGGAGSDTLVADFRDFAVALAMAAPSPDGLGGHSGSIAGGGYQLDFAGIETFVVTGGSAADSIVGGSGHDSLTGLAGSDRLEGGGGNDLLDGGAGIDTMIGGAGDDVYHTDVAGDQMTEDPDSGTDTVWTSRSMTLGDNFEALRAVAGPAARTLTGNGGDNLITGSWGSDWIDGAAGADRMEGGPGSDTYIIDNPGDVVFDNDFDPAQPPPGFPFPTYTNTARVSTASFSMVGTGLHNIVGLSAGGHNFTGNNADNHMSGNAGDDRLDGGAGRDTMVGGGGNDTYVVDNALDRIQETAGGGTDEVLVSLINYELPAEVENATLMVAAFNQLYGNGLDNVLRGTDQSETFDGRGGADTMIGGLGGDWYHVDNAGDVVIEAPGDVGFWSDKVFTSLAHYEIPVGVELLEGTGATQTLIGSEGDEWIISAGGGDTMIGRGGDDLYYVEAGDTVVELEDGGTDMVRTTLASYTLSDNVEELQAVSFSFAQTLIGNALDNRIIGTLLNNQSDTIDGGLGADMMIGWHGSDIYYVDNAGDSVVEEAHHGTADEVRTSLASYSLFGTNVENLTATSDGPHDFRGSVGNNVVTGRGGNDFLRLQDGGVDIATGGDGDDVFLFGATLNGADQVHGGAGRDQIAIQGHYAFANALTLGSNITGVENIAILPGDDIRFGDPGTGFYDYSLTLLDSALAAGVQLVVDANRLRVGEDFTFDGSAETEGSFFIYGGAGIDRLTGGSGNDVFLFGAWDQWNPSDIITGGAGRDQLALRGNYTLTFGAGQLIGIENIGLLSAHDTRFGSLGSSYSYDLKTVDENVAPGVQMTVDGAKLRIAEFFRFDGSAEMDGSFRVFGGLVDDTIIGSNNADILQGHGGLDTLTGGGGGDAFRYVATSDSAPGSADRILDFLPGTDWIDLSRIDANSHAAGDQAFHWIGSSTFTGTHAASAGELRAYQGANAWFVEGDTDGNGAADFIIEVVVVGQAPLGEGHFLL